jgi:hypothetical protein
MRPKKSVNARIENTCGAVANVKPLHVVKNRARRGLGELRDALSEGWQIVQPIFARPHWTSVDDQQTAFHFVLQRDQSVRLLTIPDDNTIERFIHDRALVVNQH